jgi:thioesterase domain-containing protein
MAEAYRADLDRTPDFLGGWSMGGLIAFELARTTPVPLLLLDPAPPVGYAYRPTFGDFVAMTAAGLGIRLDVPRAGDLDVAVLAAYLKHADQDVPAAVLSERWETYQRHVKAVADYLPESGISTPALLFAAELLDVQIEQWADVLGPTESIRLDTDHFGVLSARSMETIAATLSTGWRRLDLSDR